MRNDFKTTIQVTRKDICNLILACAAARICAGTSEINGVFKGGKWENLQIKLSAQLDELDRQLDLLVNDEK